jgi:hypothetical protein
MRLRSTLLGAAGVLALVAPAAHATTPSADCHLVAVTDAANDQYIGSSANVAVRPTVALDIREVFITGTPGDLKLNLRLGSLDVADPAVARQLTRYTVSFTDPFSGADYEFSASWDVEDPTGTDTGGYNVRRINSLFAATGRVFAEANGVIQWDMPNTLGLATITYPSTLWDLRAYSEQYETNAVQEPGLGIRNDIATQASYTSPC